MIPISITTFNIDLLTVGLAGAAICLMGILIYLNNPRSATNKAFLFFAVFTIVWNFTNFLQYKFTTIEATLWALRFNLFVAVWHAYSFFRLAYVFPAEEITWPSWCKYILFPLTAATSILTLTPLVFSGIEQLASAGEVTNPTRGPLIVLFSAVAFGLLILGLGMLLRRIMLQKTDRKAQLVYFFIGMLITAFLILFFSLLLPIFFNTLTFLPFAAIFMLPFVLLVSYSIYRFKLFNLKVVTSGIFVFILAGLTFVEVVFTDGALLLALRVLLLALVVSAGVLLTKSVMREVEQREEIQILAENLKVANDKLKELDKLKSQFLSIATHELRTPLTVVRNFISLMLDGSYGKVPDAIAESGRQVFERVTDMAHSVDTYLNVSRIEQGKIKYDFAPSNLSELVKKTVHGLAPVAEKKLLELKLTIAKGAESLNVNVDSAKITEVITNLIDNSIKYTPKGSVILTVEKIEDKARITIKDTGVGMSQKTMDNLFKLFSPGDDSKKINPASTGVGLFISRSHIQAHNGTLVAESAGIGKGSRFVMELPLV